MVFVAVGTLEKTVSSDTVSVENVSMLLRDVVNESSSEHETKAIPKHVRMANRHEKKPFLIEDVVIWFILVITFFSF